MATIKKGKLIVDLDNPIWQSEPGFGKNSIRSPGPLCALGKFREVTQAYISPYNAMIDPLVLQVEKFVKSKYPITSINDGDILHPSCNSDNHWLAVRKLMEALACCPLVTLKQDLKPEGNPDFLWLKAGMR